MDTSRSFRQLLLSLSEYFEREPAARSVETEHFGTLSREDVARLLPLTQER